jgi:hypothetical protein
MPLSTIIMLYRGGLFYLWTKPDYQQKQTSIYRTLLVNLIIYEDVPWAGNRPPQL